MIQLPWLPHSTPNNVDNVLQVGQTVVHHTYLAGFKDGLLMAVAIFSILLVLFRRD